MPLSPDTEQTAFVTGANGLLGSWLVKALLQQKHRVVLLTHGLRSDSALNLMGLKDKVVEVVGDITDRDLLEATLAQYEVDTVYHLAAHTIVGSSERSPLSTFEVNIRGTWLLLEAARTVGVSGIIVASSDKAYGEQPQLPYKEDSPLLAKWPYEVSKAAADMVARSYGVTYQLPVLVTRCANIYGGGDLNRSRLIPEAITAVLEGRRPVIRSDGTPKRDFIYVEDVVKAYLALMQELSLNKELTGQAVNIGSGRAYSVLEVIKTITELSGGSLTPDIKGSSNPKGEISEQCVDATYLAKLTGWTAEHSLKNGLDKTLSWYKEHYF